jgi:hypothetical protein
MSYAKTGLNNYILFGNIAIIEIKNRKGQLFYTIIDAKDIPKLEKLNYHWCIWKDNSTNTYYVRSSIFLGKIDGKNKYDVLYLHKIIFGDNIGMIDHINNNSLDNRKSNLRKINNTNNLRNRKGINKSNKSGYRNVSKSGNKWLVSLQIDGKQKRLKYFYDVDEAGNYAKEMRKKYYGEFAGQ